MRIDITGVDPGLVHTGVVGITMATEDRILTVRHKIVLGPNVEEVLKFNYSTSRTFIEGYRTRGQFNTNNRMIQAVAEMKKGIPNSVVVPNMGIKKVVKPELLRIMNLQKFPTSNHQDLQSAARILVLGMLKDPALNYVLADFVNDHINDRVWKIQ